MLTDLLLIWENIYLSNKELALRHDLIEKHGIKHIITVAPSDECSEQELRQPHDDSVSFYRIPINDNGLDALSPYLKDAFQYIKMHPTENILVHCISGQSRSPAFLIAWLICEKGKNGKEAFELLKSLVSAQEKQVIQGLSKLEQKRLQLQGVSSVTQLISPKYQLFEELINLEKEVLKISTLKHEDNYIPIVI